MRLFVTFFLIAISGVVIFISCEKYHDPKPIHDPALTNPYCNDPNAVNYNWGFPGVPDNSICFYPVDLFKGTYVFNDSVYQVSTGYFIYYRIDTLYIYPYSETQMAVVGFCTQHGDTLKMTSEGATYVATVDTLVGDSLTNSQGQLGCMPADTINGNITKDIVDSNVLHVSFTQNTDTGTMQYMHVGTATKQ